MTLALFLQPRSMHGAPITSSIADGTNVPAAVTIVQCAESSVSSLNWIHWTATELSARRCTTVSCVHSPEDTVVEPHMTALINDRVNSTSRTMFTQPEDSKISYCRDSAWCGWNGHSRSLEVIRCCANRHGIYDFLLALNNNLSSIFNHFWDIIRTLQLSTVHLSSRWNWKKTAVRRWTCFGVRVPRKLYYPTIKLNLH